MYDRRYTSFTRSLPWFLSAFLRERFNSHMIVIVRKVNGVVGPSTRDWLRLTSDNRRIVDVNLRASG
jgi:hypothetical protein